MDEFDLRLEIRVKNNILWHAVLDSYPSVAAFCRNNPSVDYTQLILLLALNKHPKTAKSGKYRKVCEEISRTLQRPCEELFPIELYDKIDRSSATLEISSQTGRSIPARVTKLLPKRNKITWLDARICEILSKLPTQDQQIGAALFGINRPRLGVTAASEEFRISVHRVGLLKREIFRLLRSSADKKPDRRSE